LPELIDATVDSALHRDGLEDRKIILRNQGFIEDQKAPAVVIDQRQQLTIGGVSDFEKLIKGRTETKQLEGVIDAEAIISEEIPQSLTSGETGDSGVGGQRGDTRVDMAGRGGEVGVSEVLQCGLDSGGGQGQPDDSAPSE
jgi:hypothetical protein